jgi:hypothetical protein
MHISFKG